MFLNNSSAEVYENCWRKGFWSREYRGLGGPGGIEPRYRNENLMFGVLVHAMLAQLYAGKVVHEAIELGWEEFKTEFDFDDFDYEEQNKWQENYEWAGRILQEYDLWREENDDFQPLQIETEGCVVLGEECYQCGAEYPETANDTPAAFTACPTCEAEVHHWVFRIDIVIADGNYVEIVDHKTAKSASDLYIASWDFSMQQYGYCYGYSKATGMEVTGYRMNIIRKLKTIGTPQQTMKNCPTCNNRTKKPPTKHNCQTCEGTGKVEKENNPSDQPFQRPHTYDFNDERRERFVRQRTSTIRRIKAERELFEMAPDEAWPMNPKACFTYGKCPFLRLCYEGDPEVWYEPSDILLDNFEPKGEDYVTVRELAKEEMQ